MSIDAIGYIVVYTVPLGLLFVIVALMIGDDENAAEGDDQE